MKAYRALLAFLGLALLAALLAWVIGADPGYVLIQRGNWTVETSIVFAVLALLVLWIALTVALWLARWPLRAMAQRARRRGRVQYARGVLALVEGRPARAENLLLSVSRMRSLRLPALLGAYQAARQRGEVKRQGEILAKLSATPEGDVAATVLRAQAELDEGRAGTAIELLTPLDQAQRLPPAGVRTLCLSLAQRGRARETLTLLSRVRRSQLLSPAAADRFEADILARALTQASDAINLSSLWAEFNRGQRREPEVALAYARRAAALNLGDAAAGEIEAVLKRSWSNDLAAAWAELPSSDRALRLRIGEAWLGEHGARWGLTLALGRLCREQALWGKSEEYLRRALAAGGGAAAWEELGRLYDAQKDHERAARAYANAIAVTRGDHAAAVAGRSFRDDLSAPLAVVEERNEHGVPRLPHGAVGESR